MRKRSDILNEDRPMLFDGRAHDTDPFLICDILPMLDVNENARRIWRYTLPEMLNNAIEHSQGSKVRVHAQLNHLYSRICITDDGIGIFINTRHS